jgi:PAS domain S-box-containing protein
MNRAMKNLQNDITLLYIENDPKVSASTYSILKEFFQIVILAENAEDALDKFQRYNIHFIITDLEIPTINGVEIIQEIRKQNSSIPIIITSSQIDPEHLQRSIGLGIDGYLIKPLNHEYLKTLINKGKEKIYKEREQQKELRLLEQYQAIVDRSAIISKTNLQGIITYVNEKFCQVSGYTKEELVGKNHNIVRAKDVPKETFRELWHTIRDQKKTWRGIIKNRAKGGELYYVDSTVRPILDEDGNIEEYIAHRSLITNIIHPKEQLFDFLALAEKPFVVLMKLENFDYIETILDKKANRSLQQDFATELFTRQIGSFKFSKIYLLDHGEFIFVQDMEQCIKDIPEMIEQLQEFQEEINKSKITISPINYNLSIVMSLSYGQDAFENAKIGLQKLQQSKENFIVEKNSFGIQKQESLKKIETLKMVQEAIESFNIISYFQPIVNNKTKKVEKYESLVRLINSEKKILSPYFFLETSKKSRYYAQITSIVLENSFRALEETKLNISINLSALDIERTETREIFFALLREHKESAKRIILELVEDEDIVDFETIKKFITQVKAYDVKIAIDDFGTGYSNFKRILEYQPDFIKIDGSLIKNIEVNQLSLDIVSSIVDFAKKQKIQTIAEFVENESIYHRICELGIDYSQGYYFGKPTVLV